MSNEARLRESGGYDEHDTMLLEPLAPGAPFWPDLPPPLPRPTTAVEGVTPPRFSLSVLYKVVKGIRQADVE
jgi:hypothetical protein